MIELVLPYPPSVNSYWRHLSKGPLAGRTLLSEDGRKYRSQIQQALVLQRAGNVGASRVHVDIEARMPDRRKRDLDNLPKAIFDALTHAGFWNDDSQIDDMRVWRSERMGGEVILRVKVMETVQREILVAA